MLGKFFSGLWRFINGTRLVFLNLLFFGFMAVLILTMVQPEGTQRLEAQTTLVLQPHGMIVEEYSSSALDRAIQEATDQTQPETRLRDLLTVIRHARNDTRIAQMLIDTSYLWGVGLSSLQDLEAAIEEFKESGKPVVALGTSMSQHQYYLASIADEVWLHNDGTVWIDGYANVRQFYREGLEKLAVEINLFRVGEYKSAMEPFIRDDMSPAAKEASQFWLGSLWQQYLEGISQNRGIPLESLSEGIEEFPDRVESLNGDMAQVALQAGLVDRLVTLPEARQELALRAAPNKSGDSFRAIDVDGYLDATGLSVPKLSRGEVAIVVAEGEIVGGKASPGRIGSEDTIRQLRALGRDDSVKAVVIRVNSPGGEVTASERIRLEIEALKDSGKTIVVSMGDVAASGGYWIAVGADEIWASPSTITGSIGVFGMLPTFGETLGKMGIYSDGVGTTSLAGKMRIDQPLDNSIRRIFQASTEHVYETFLELIDNDRGEIVRNKAGVDSVDQVAQGRVWSGAQAAERGLVDQLGSLQQATDAAARIAGLGSDYSVTYSEREVSAFERFIIDMTGGAVAYLNPKNHMPSWTRNSFIQRVLSDLEFIAQSDGQLTIAAHCLCEIK